VPWRVEVLGEPARAAHGTLCPGWSDAREHAFARFPNLADRLVHAILAHLIVDAVGGLAQRSSRNAMRLPLRKKFCTARRACSADRLCLP
jgi:hypothetical protein